VTFKKRKKEPEGLFFFSIHTLLKQPPKEVDVDGHGLKFHPIPIGAAFSDLCVTHSTTKEK
jgi:hypothetical protein